MKQFLAPSLIALGVLAFAPAQAATPVQIVWQGVDTAGTKLSMQDDTVSTTTPVTSNYATTALNYTYVASGDSFIAYCIEPEQPNGRAGFSRDYFADSFSGDQAQRLQALFSTTYAQLNTYTDKAAFQVALWEVLRETAGSFDATSGSFHILGDDATSAQVAALANSFMATAASYNGPALYSLTRLTSANLQDLVTATTITAVPEPETYALLLAGLGIVGLVGRRRLPR
ncbi:MAG: PEP-CTERM sorting domain-containing protein [Roseateles sp.]|uniref:PEP-CTERM sorting domain-containing protein n=1 Tax=Roseateles sp. TaxID=1971397 RepID=UPI004036ADBA